MADESRKQGHMRCLSCNKESSSFKCRNCKRIEVMKTEFCDCGHSRYNHSKKRLRCLLYKCDCPSFVFHRTNQEGILKFIGGKPK